MRINSDDDRPMGERIDEIDDDVPALQKGGRHTVEDKDHQHRLDQIIGAADRTVEYVAQEHIQQRDGHHDDERH